MDDGSQNQSVEAPVSGHKKIDWFGVDVISAFVIAFVGDLLSIIIIPHYFAAAAIFAILWPRTKGIIVKLILIVAFIIPFPGLLMLAVFLAILFTNSKALEVVVTQVGVIAVTVATGGAGAVAEGAVAGGEAAAVAAEGVAATAEASTAAAETAQAAARTAEEVGTVSGEAGEGAASEQNAGRSSETLRQKAERKLKEKFKERLENGDGDDDQGGPTEQEIIAEMEKERELDRALGGGTSPMEDVEADLFKERSPFNANSVNNEDDTSSHSRLAQMPDPSGRKRPSTQDILAKSENLKAQWNKNRDISAADDDSKGMAA